MERIKVGGKFSFSSLPSNIKEKVKEKIVKKYNIPLDKVPNLLIDGKEVTKENIHEFEINKTSVLKEKQKEVKEKPKKELYEKSDLEKLKFLELKKIANKFGQTGRSKKGLIKDILKFQK